MFYYIFYEALFRNYASQFPLLKALNVFKYVTFRTAYAAITALALSLIFGPVVIRKLTEFKFGQEIREEGPASHQAKRGTPTMGGVMIIGSGFISPLLWGDLKSWLLWIALLGMAGCGAIGFADDYIKIVKKRSLGLTGLQKIAGQLLVGASGSGLLFVTPKYSSVLYVPFFKTLQPDLTVLGYSAFIIFVLIATSN